MGLGLELEPVAGLHYLVKGWRPYARVERHPSPFGPLPLRVEIVEPHHEPLVLFQGSSVNPGSFRRPREERVIVVSFTA